MRAGPAAHIELSEWKSPAFAADSAVPSRASQTIEVDDSIQLQPVWGVGATLTNTASYLLNRGVTGPLREKVIDDLFGASHAHFGFVRITIGGSDFNVGGVRYSEDDMPKGQSDPSLRHFSLRHDADTIAVLRLALHDNPHLRIFASPWSAPAWMKTNDSLEDFGLDGYLLRRYYPTYAEYFVKYITGFQRAGIPIWGVTVQNEPFRVPATYEGMTWPVVDESLFIRDFLRPALRRAGLHTHIFGVDASWDGLGYGHAETTLAGGLDGLAWHCYNGNADTGMAQFPGMPQILSECATSLIRAPVTALLDNVFNDGGNAAVLWNMAEDPSGGPVVPPNQGCHGCRGIVVIDPRRHTVAYNEEFFDLQQFGQVLRDGAHRIAATRLGRFDPSRRTDRASAGLHDVAFRNPDGTDIVVVYNNSTTTLRFKVWWQHRSYASRIPGRSTITLSWQAPRRRR